MNLKFRSRPRLNTKNILLSFVVGSNHKNLECIKLLKHETLKFEVRTTNIEPASNQHSCGKFGCEDIRVEEELPKAIVCSQNILPIYNDLDDQIQAVQINVPLKYYDINNKFTKE